MGRRSESEEEQSRIVSGRATALRIGVEASPLLSSSTIKPLVLSLPKKTRKLTGPAPTRQDAQLEHDDNL